MKGVFETYLQSYEGSKTIHSKMCKKIYRKGPIFENFKWPYLRNPFELYPMCLNSNWLRQETKIWEAYIRKVICYHQRRVCYSLSTMDQSELLFLNSRSFS